MCEGSEGAVDAHGSDGQKATFANGLAGAKWQPSVRVRFLYDFCVDAMLLLRTAHAHIAPCLHYSK